MSAPRVAVLNHDLLQQHVLSDTLRRLGFDLVLNTVPGRLSAAQLQETETDVWLINMADADDEFDGFEALLDGEVPVLIGMDPAPQKSCTTYLRWEKRLLSKLQDLTHAPAPAAEVPDTALTPRTSGGADIPLPAVFRDRQGERALEVWVLGASLGGPEAVKMFLDALPAGLPVAFVYAQHIDPRFEEALCQAVGRHASYQLRNYEEGLRLKAGDVLVAPVSHQFTMAGLDEVSLEAAPWNGPYGPSIDGVIDAVSRHACSRFGCILFSGMGSDGADSILGLPADKPVWVQRPDTCGNSSMPESAIGTGRVNFIGDPYQLALQLVQHINRTWTEHYEPDSHHHG
ncbi:chemotaxis protein CheB [uncultured Thalassolituus sp.]|uniref:chemotaxis protein CheB n=1 Tax=uncultured Thalassolituus sp. TaxID=285273 RepID=UPI0026076177|nr:chemotaxis protein CheB [uncultured Thalassolituus sp.]